MDIEPVSIPMITKPVKVHMIAKSLPGIDVGLRSPYLRHEHYYFRQTERLTARTLRL